MDSRFLYNGDERQSMTTESSGRITPRFSILRPSVGRLSIESRASVASTFKVEITQHSARVQKDTSLAELAHYDIDVWLRLKKEVCINASEIENFRASLKVATHQNDRSATQNFHSATALLWENHRKSIIKYLADLSIPKSEAEKKFKGWVTQQLEITPQAEEKVIQFVKYMKSLYLISRMESWLSPKRDKDFSIELQQRLQPQHIYFTRLQHLAALINRVACSVQPGMSAENIKPLIDNEIEEECFSYEAELKREKEKNHDPDELERLQQDMRDHLVSETAPLVTALAVKTIEELELYRANASDDVQRTADNNEIVQDELAMQEAATMEACNHIREHTIVKGLEDVEEDMSAEKLDVLALDCDGKTFSDKIIESENLSLIKKVIDYAQQRHKETFSEMLHHLNSIINQDGPVGLFYLAIHGCLFDVALMAEIGASLAPCAVKKLPFYDSNPTDSPGKVRPFETLFDEQNHFIPPSQLIDYAIQHADAETFALLLKNILGQFSENRQKKILPDYLERATEFGRCAHIAKILACADDYKVIWGEATSKSKKEKNLEKQENLDVGFCLFDPKSFSRVGFSKQSSGDINKKLLKYADDQVLADFIQQVGRDSWPHDAEDAAIEIRRELEKRFVIPDKPLTPQIQAALQKNWNVKQDAEKLVTYYDTATRHIVEQYQSNPALYANKAEDISRKANHTVQNASGTLIKKAEYLGNRLLTEFTPVNARSRPGFFSDPHLYNKTQRLVNARKRELEQKPSMLGSILGWNHQHGKEILNQENIQLGLFLSRKELYEIPITHQEKEARVQRAVLARGAFKETLDYLKNGSNSTKSNIMNTYLQNFIDGYDATGQAYSQLNLKEDITNASKRDGVLGKRKFWSRMWSSPSKTGRKATDDLAKLNNITTTSVTAA
jgi:hypothetical protein